MVDLADKADDLLTIFDASDVDTKLNTFNDTLQHPCSHEIHQDFKQTPSFCQQGYQGSHEI
ncbi:unnamed protein product [Pocillopora meandrina]|uniref:Uncharacterized protein n=1 Tax=Pocillopora meandrina TaxID=46732 RepID=A0AAU9WSA7_9CNID|nr:unnamed protein product [Pocillopora meandrina]